MQPELSGTYMVVGDSSVVKNLSSSTIIKTEAGKLVNVTINSHTSGVFSLYNGTSALGSLMHSSITLAAGERSIPFYGEIFDTGLFVNVGGTANLSFQYR